MAANPAAIAPASPARESLQPPLDTAAGAAARESVAAASSTAGRSPAQNSAPSPATTAGHTVQFANSGRIVPASVTHSRTPSGVDGVDGLGGGTSTAPRDGRPPTLLGKLRALASRGDDDSSPTSSDSDDSPGDADAESSGGEGPVARPKRQLRRSRPRRRSDTTPDLAAPAGGSSSTTPRASARGIGRSPFLSRHARVPSAPADGRLRAAMLPGRRRVPPPFASSHGREGVSEDEGKERLNRRRLRDAWANNPKDDRPRNLRRLTALAGPRDNPDSLAAAWRRHRGDRSSLSGQRWKHIKASLRMMGQRRRDTSAVDQAKSAELLAELSSGVPAALLLASMFQRDEHGKRRIPILLEQLKVRITDSYLDSPSAGDRHPVFRIELEYGSGLTRMKWVIHRSIRDFANLHLKYKLHLGTQKYITLRAPDAANSLPRFPKSALPYLRGVRGLEDYIDDDDDDEDEDEQQQEQQQDEGPPAADDHSVANRPRRKRPSSRPPSHRRSSGSRPGSAVGPRRESYPERQRKKLETYLQKMIRFFIFQPDSNRLCRFLELSALGVRLAAEGSYHGKEGFLFIQYSKGLDFRSAFNPSLIKSRHSPKWFLVRHSYVVCVDSPEEMHIYDVFLVDPAFCIQNSSAKVDIKGKEIEGGRAVEAPTGTEAAGTPKPSTPPSGKHHTLKLRNSERKLRLLARNERQLRQFEDSIRFMVANTPWSRPNRFGSFAPVRPNCFAQWLVDARDHMWMVSRAINQAKDVVYIHDWWLSPELYMRRPAAISQKWRLDRLLQRKAVQGVKIFVIMYRNINSAIPIDSEYSKFSLLDLHPNVFVQRSPNQFRQNTFFWAHHEKVCIVDHTLAFVGGIDLCFGRWDTPQHLVTDDKLTGFEQTDLPKDADHCQLWPGKDYSNPRMQDFYDLDKPYEEMYDREAVPRMPWHDISMHVVGQPARDLTRHFVQRWNYILRQRKPTRPTPFLLPPPDFSAADLEALGLDGTCEIQVLRSSSMWSTGTPDTTEHSIMNAYVKLIEQSDHFVYMENQFFISACDVHGKRVENLIADALVERIVRAAEEGTNWRAVILIPLMPGFQNPVDTEGGTSVRLIMMCQYRSICRGEASIFGRLRARGIDPADYIEFYSLRNWGKIGPRRKLVTEQLYIHAKCLIVDDRAALIASANINERSMLGSRDSEAGAVVRDTDLLWSSMDGRPYLVGRFPHTLRMRLMREHLGIDVDELLEKQMDADAAAASDEIQPDSPERVDGVDRADQRKLLEHRHQLQDEFIARSEDMHSFNHDVDWEQGRNPNLLRGGPSKKLTSDSRVIGNSVHAADVRGEGIDHMQAALTTATSSGGAPVGKGRDSVVRGRHSEVLVSPEAEAAELGTRPGPDRLAGQPETGTTEQSLSNNGSPGESVEAVDETIKAPNGADDNAVATTAPSDHPLTHTAARKILGTNLPSHRESVGSNNGHGGSGSGNGNGNGNGYGAAAAVGGGAAAPAVTQPIVDVDCMRDPVHSSFYCGIWRAVADNNTRLYRTVFRCMPDSEVKSWREYKEYAAYAERFVDAQNSYYYNDRNRSPCAEPATQRGLNAGAGGEGDGRDGGDGGDGGDGAAGAAPPPGPAVATVAPPSGVPTVDEQVVQTDKLPTSQQLMMSSPGEHGETDAAAPSTELSRLLSTEQLRNWAAEANRAQMEREKTAVAQGTTPETADAEKQNQGQGGGGETSEGLGRENKKEQAQELEGEKKPSPAPPPQPSVTVSEPTEPTVVFPDVETEKGQSPANAGAATADSHQQQQQHLQRPQRQPSQRRRRRATTRGSRRSFLASDDILSMGEAEELLQLVQGHLVRWPYDWLEKEEEGGNWLYALDQISPLEIYN